MGNIFIGKIIAKKVKESHLSVAEFAKRINRSRTTVYDIFSRKSIDIELLMIISEALNYDFLTEIYLPARHNIKPKRAFVLIEVDPSQVPADLKEISLQNRGDIKLLLKEKLKSDIEKQA
ncbi:MAG: helix-turn-helix domain-containing protein [Bacteroidales bacterium]|jgi:transcriptional regulator with XRE-family HTH domain|nr:helix-turn-helix domain-containing protein [Bacteroidales bacterium]MDD2824993.1 helix-turn-helix domain-containing protein [Bacteroidales bacterium]MDD3100774.1 helix-turn-helix domain-containing protein [Bacteroidales bacterium]MDD3639727.1 helix-turn-helix domain-containing protein [Bacteroidales bacterium]MDD3944352.1 helix-turn-helix domain-containing protein [Bacteroidales bacterium]